MIKSWFIATRPKTLISSMSPILLGGVLAASRADISIMLLVCCFIVGISLQITANLANDYYDWKKNIDGRDRLGPPRACAAGFIKPSNVKLGFVCSSLIAAMAGLYIFWFTGWEVIVLGLVCIIMSVAYTVGPLPLSHLGMGEFAAFIFFGIVPCLSTFYVLTGQISEASLLSGIMCGFYAAALMAVNNLRDIKSDMKSSKKTLAVRVGESKARLITVGLFIIAVAWPIVIAIRSGNWLILTALILIPVNFKFIASILRDDITEKLNSHLAAVVKAEAIASLVIAITWNMK